MSSREPASVPASNPLSALLDFFGRVLEVIPKSKGKQLGVLGLVILAALAAVVLAQPGTDPESGQIAVVVLSLVAGLVVLVTSTRNGIPAALAVFAFGLAAAYLVFPPAPPPAPQENLRVAGNVRYRNSNAGVEGAQVTVEGFGESTTTRDGNGYFEFENGIPPHIVKNTGDSLIFMVRHAIIEEFRTAPRGPFRFFVTPPESPVAAADPSGGPARAWWAQSQRALPRELPPVRVILDSIRTLQDGTAGWSTWAFEVEVDGHDQLDLPHGQYSDEAGRSLVLLGREVKLRRAPGETIQITVEGTRNKYFFGRHQAKGSKTIALARLEAEVPVPVLIPVHVTRERKEGDFLFYFTVVRIGPPQMQKAGKGLVHRAPRCAGCGRDA